MVQCRPLSLNDSSHWVQCLTLSALLRSEAFFSLPFTWTPPAPFMMGKPFNSTLVEEKIILKLVKIIRKTVFKGIAIGGVKTIAVGEKDQAEF